MTTTATATPYSAPATAAPQPLAFIATTRQGPVREMSEMLTRRYGPGLQIQQERGRTTWLIPAAKKPAPSRASHLPVPGRNDR